MLTANFSAEYNCAEGYGKIVVTEVITDNRKTLVLKAFTHGNLKVIFDELAKEGDSKHRNGT